MKTAIAYYRVSTSGQGKSGLGLKAQQTAVKNYCVTNGYTLLQEIQEVQSTRKHRPRLQEAFARCQTRGATLIVAWLDRLGRDVEEIAHNVKLPVDIIVTDNPHANRLTIHILAAVAEEQRRTISENTKAALKATKLKGTQLGKYGKTLAKKNKRQADAFARKMQPIFKQLECEGYTSVRKLAIELNRRKVPTFRKGSKWHGKSVWNVMRRLQTIQL
jgi:DNA invertase Pin-like site-specific DNA recombinase